VTPLVTSDFSYNVSELAEKIPLDRLLLETDAPYFVPQENVSKFVWLFLPFFGGEISYFKKYFSFLLRV
jgi:Tat protein secretion system quality control protein TatD with DNase activity